MDLPIYYQYAKIVLFFKLNEKIKISPYFFTLFAVMSRKEEP